MSESETNDGRTILDYLNEDCWRTVLRYVPLHDILRSEPVSQGWQKAMLMYLRGVRIRIKPPARFWRSVRAPRAKWRHIDRLGKRNRVAKMKMTDASCLSFESWTCKLGPSVVAAYCNSENSLNMYENCPNLEALMLVKLQEETIQKNHNANFKWLKRICFNECQFVLDRSIKRYMTNSTIEELEIHGNSKVTGQFLNNKKKTNLISLVLNRCWFLELPPLLLAGDALSGLRKLELTGASATYNDIHLLLDKMPKLEHVKVLGSEKKGDKFFDAVCRLSRLKYLCVDFEATDAHLEAVARCCPEMQRLKLRSCHVTQRGVKAACAYAGMRLTALGVVHSHLSDDAVLACVRACPNLTLLNLRKVFGLTHSLLPRVVSARHELQARGTLKIHVLGALYGGVLPNRVVQEKYDDLIILA